MTLLVHHGGVSNPSLRGKASKVVLRPDLPGREGGRQAGREGGRKGERSSQAVICWQRELEEGGREGGREGGGATYHRVKIQLMDVHGALFR